MLWPFAASSASRRRPGMTDSSPVAILYSESNMMT